MIISHRHRYVFVELPLTGSTAIAKELIDLYDGERFLLKHATYRDFLRACQSDWRDYFAFSGIRHPLDQAVSQYEKLVSDHKGRISGRGQTDRRRGIHFALVRAAENRRFAYVHGADVSFSHFLRKFYKLPYSNWSVLDHDRLNSIIRFENISADFARTLEMIGLESKRQLPIVNKTEGKRDWIEYFDSPEMQKYAYRIFGPFMRHWNYDFPAAWIIPKPTQFSNLSYEFITVLRKIYWINFRYRF